MGISLISFLGMDDCTDPCADILCALADCDDLEACGPSGQSLYDADFELETAGMSNDNCSACGSLNDTFLSSAPQSGTGCLCIHKSEVTGLCGLQPNIGYAWHIAPPGCTNRIHGNYTGFDISNWRVEASLRSLDVNSANNDGPVFGLYGSAAASAVLTLCAGGEVELPRIGHFGGLDWCSSSGATAILRSIY